MKWTSEELQTIDQEQALYIAIPNGDGLMHKPTYIWGVSTNGDFYARGASGTDTKWYQAAHREKKAHITIGNIEKDVTLSFSVDERTRKDIDAAYKEKYDSVIELMTSDAVAAATVKMTPID